MKSRKAALWLGVPALSLSCLLVPPARASLLVPMLAEINVDVVLGAPPPPRHEVIIERDRPSKDHVWVAGYWAARGGRQEWVAGHWELPPRGRTVWVAPRWEKRDRGYVFIEGSWAAPGR
jgi:hypothetical protein